MRVTWLFAHVLALSLGVASSGMAQAQSPVATMAPPNVPAVVSIAQGRLTVTYEGHTIASATLRGLGAGVSFHQLEDTSRSIVTQVLKWTSLRGEPLTLAVEVLSSDQAFPVESDPPPRTRAMVRNSVGLSHSRRNQAIYDRARDWLLSVDHPASVTIAPDTLADGSTRFTVTASGSEIALRFRPRFYQRHRGLATYEPWTYRLPREVPTGWTSWYAYRDRITERDVRRVADVMAERLAPYGYRWLQLDDGYQQLPIGVVQHWLTPNEKFPSGMDSLARYITGRGLLPGIWTNVSFQDTAWSAAHPSYFVRGATGAPAYGNWVGWVLDANAPATYATLFAPVYEGLRDMGYRYFKVDALRHLRYEGFNSHADYFGASRETRGAEFRAFMTRLRQTIGPDNFILACWGVRPELIGLVDAVRIGDDGFGYGGLAQYNSFNNVVWRNDPDHIEVQSRDAYAAAMATTLTGSHLMLTDLAEVYRTPRVEVARRTSPVLSTVPQQVYDVDPSRSAQLARADVELSGAGPRPLDADQSPVTHLYQLDIARPFERWTVLGRTGGADTSMSFAELGLPADSEYLVFEFWSGRLHPSRRDGFSFGPLDPTYAAQSFCIRPRTNHPQLVATNRHVTCGGPDLIDVQWKEEVVQGTSLQGTSMLVADETYRLYLTEPAGYRLQQAAATGAAVSGISREGRLLVVSLRSATGGRVRWSVRYRAGSSPRRSPTAH